MPPTPTHLSNVKTRIQLRKMGRRKIKWLVLDRLTGTMYAEGHAATQEAAQKLASTAQKTYEQHRSIRCSS